MKRHGCEKKLLVCSYGLNYGQITLETIARLKTADRVFFASTGADSCPAFLKNLSANSEFITDQTLPQQLDSVFMALEGCRIVAVVTYGDPAFLCNLTREFGLRCKSEGVAMEIIPAISSFNSLMAIFGLNMLRPAGLYIIGANSFFDVGVKLNTAVPTLIFQPDILLVPDHSALLNSFKAELARLYPPGAPVFIAQAQSVSVAGGRVRKFRVGDIDRVFSHVTIASTLYLPPLPAEGILEPF